MTQNFLLAAKDYRYLLDREYQPASMLQMISNRYELSSVERSMLYRGIYSQKDCLTRLKKVIPTPASLQNNLLVIDGYNVLITIASYLQGLPVFVAGDGLLRDAAYARGKFQKMIKLPEAAGILACHLPRLITLRTEIYFDRQVGWHPEIMTIIRQNLHVEEEKFQIAVLDNVDQTLINKSYGIICTSDSVIVAKTNCMVFDMARYALENSFHPEFMDLSRLVK